MRDEGRSPFVAASLQFFALIRVRKVFFQIQIFPKERLFGEEISVQGLGVAAKMFMHPFDLRPCRRKLALSIGVHVQYPEICRYVILQRPVAQAEGSKVRHKQFQQQRLNQVRRDVLIVDGSGAGLAGIDLQRQF